VESSHVFAANGLVTDFKTSGTCFKTSLKVTGLVLCHSENFSWASFSLINPPEAHSSGIHVASSSLQLIAATFAC